MRIREPKRFVVILSGTRHLAAALTLLGVWRVFVLRFVVSVGRFRLPEKTKKGGNCTPPFFIVFMPLVTIAWIVFFLQSRKQPA